MADKEYGSDAAHGLSGFSSNSHWADPDGAWSHHPVTEGPKAGFHDPVDAEPARKQLWGGGSEAAASDISVSLSLGGGSLG